MGGIVEGGVGIDTKTSPRRAAIDKAQAELRLEYDIREERRRELEFLEKGFNPLDFKFGITNPLSVQSSSLADQINDQSGNCEARGGFSSAASPVGDSIGSSGRLGANVACEPNGADNFDVENEITQSKGMHKYASRSDNTPSEHSSQLGGTQNVRESGDSPIFHPKRAYRRRNRSKTNRDSARLSATDISSHRGHKFPLSDRHRVVSEAAVQESPSDTEVDGLTAAVPTRGGLPEGKGLSTSKHDSPHNQNIQKDAVYTHNQNIQNHEVTITMTSLEPDPSMEIEQQRKLDELKGDGKVLQNEGVDSTLAVTLKGLISELSCTQTRGDVGGNSDSRPCSMKNVDSIQEQMKQKVPLGLTENNKAENILKDRKMDDIAESNSCINDCRSSQSCQAHGFPDHDQEETEKNSKVGLQQGSVESHCPNKQQEPYRIHDISCSASIPELQPCANQAKVVDKEREERILEKARNIMAKRKIMEDLSLGSLLKEYRGKTHWDFVLEEMAWMANDFAQERVWKRTSATQLCHRAAFASRIRFGERDTHEREKAVSRTLAKAVVDFWHSASLLVGVNGSGSVSETCAYSTAIFENMDSNNNAKVDSRSRNKEYVKDKLALQGYAVRFLQLNSSAMPIVKDRTSQTPEGAFTIGTNEMTYQNQHAEEDLFYVVPHGAMESYRKSVERHMGQCFRNGKNIQEVNSSMYNAVGEYEYQENGYEEDEGENAYYLQFAEKKRKNPKLYTPSSYEVGGDLSYGRCINNRIRIPQSSVKRPANGINVCPIPTKRVRTASRQRVVGPFSNGPAGFMSAPSRTDASSGDTNSFQDDQSILNGGPLIGKGLEVESGMDFDKQSAFDYADYTARPKKKKTKHQRDHIRKRTESQQIDSRSNYDQFVPYAKKPKIMKQSLENSFENTTLMSGSGASPVGSQMSNMSNPNKLIKLIGGRDRGRKTKPPKMLSVHTGSGYPWSLFEDQALVVLVHDMGPNWELVSDAISSTLHSKCIFRKPQECKERHAILLEKSWGDGADTEDSGSSQPYPSTLPGIPKGGARQLFQQLRGPMEEDTIKSHFEKIILIGQQLRGRKKQEPKHLVSVHSSHLAARSQMITNSVNGGILTPLDLCDMASSTSPDIFSGSYQSPNNGNLPLPNQASSSLSFQGPPGSNMAIPSAQVNAPVRDGRHGVSRPTLPIDEQQRIQQYNQLLSSRKIQQSNMSVPGNDLGGKILPAGNGMSMPRPGLQGNMAGTPSRLNRKPGASGGQGISLLKPRDPSLMRVSHGNSRVVPSFSGAPGQSASPSGPTYPVHQQHLMHQQNSNPLSNSHHPHVQQGSAQSGCSAEQQTFAMSDARDRQLQKQRLLQRQQQQQPLSSSSPVTPAPFQQQQKSQLPRVQSQQQLQQTGRHHPPQSQQQAKFVKGMGRGNNTMMNQQHPVHSSHLNGVSNNPSQSSKPSVPSPSTQQYNSAPITPPFNQQVKVHQHPPVKLVNHGRPQIHSAVSQSHATNSDPVTERQTDQNHIEPSNTAPASEKNQLLPNQKNQLLEKSPQRHPLPNQHPQAPNSTLE